VMGTAVAKAPTLSDLAADINENHELARMFVGQAFDHAVKAGLLLIEAKKQVPHGQWLAWLKANVEVGTKQAQNYMKVAICPEEKRNAVAHLSLRKAIHELAAHKVQAGNREAARALMSPKDFAPKPAKPTGKLISKTVSPHGIVTKVYEDDPAEDDADDEEGDEASRRFRGLDECCSQGWDTAEDAWHHIEWLSEHSTIDHATLEAVSAAHKAWGRVHRLVTEKRASTLPADGRSEMAADDCTPEIEVVIPPDFLRRGAHGG
jgi:hypothetical protein